MRSKQFIKSFLVLILISPYALWGQVTIGDITPPHESAVLELKSFSNDKGFLGARVELESTSDIKTIPNPVNGLMVYNLKNSDPDLVTVPNERVSAGEYYYWAESEKRWIALVGRSEKVINEILIELGVDRPALFLLNGQTKVWGKSPEKLYPNMLGYLDPLKNTSVGYSADLPFKEMFNYTNGNVTFRDNNLIIFEPGTYEITFVYEFVTAQYATGGSITPRGCTESRYFMDFPVNKRLPNNSIEQTYARIHSSGSHYVYTDDNVRVDHGNSIVFTTTILDRTEWKVKLGRGVGGNCEKAQGFIMPNRSTFLYISRISDK